MTKSRLWLVSVACGGLLLVAGGTAAALNLDLQDGQIPPPTPSVPDPTGAGSKMKEEEAAKPSPTSVAPTAVCPTDAVVCEFAVSVADALRSGDPGAVMQLSRAITVDCSRPDSSALKPLCQGAGVASGFGIGTKSFRFVSESDFASFVGEHAREMSGSLSLLAIGCPLSTGTMDCTTFVAVTVGEPDGAILVMLAERSGNDLRVVGALQRPFTAQESLEARGGEIEYFLVTPQYQGPMFFQPVSLR